VIGPRVGLTRSFESSEVPILFQVSFQGALLGLVGWKVELRH